MWYFVCYNKNRYIYLLSLRSMFKKHGRGLISLLLLICFSVTILPLDFFHNHKQAQVCNEADRTGTCHHKLHLSQQTSYCWICAIHIDKTFDHSTLTFIHLHLEKPVALPVFKAESYYVKLIFTSLRGPPIQA